jgi:hypothetical protein
MITRRRALLSGLASFAAIDPASLFANGEEGYWFDPADTATMYQDVNGLTPSAVDSTVGLIKDKSRPLAFGAEMVTNGTFDADATGWTAIGSATLSSVAGRGRVARNGVNNPGMTQSFATVSGDWYRVRANGYLGTATSFSMRAGTAASGTQYYTTGNVTADTNLDVYIRATGATLFLTINTVISAGTNYAEWDNVSCQRVSNFGLVGNASAALRPVLRSSGGFYYLEADGVDDRLESAVNAFAAPFTRISAIRQISWGDSDRIFGGGSVTEGELQQRSATPDLSAAIAGVTVAMRNSQAAIGSDYVITEVYNPGAHSLAVNRSSPTTSSAAGGASPNGVKLFSNRFGSGNSNVRIYGVCCVKRLLTPAEIGGLRAFMALRAGINL